MDSRPSWRVHVTGGLEMALGQRLHKSLGEVSASSGTSSPHGGSVPGVDMKAAISKTWDRISLLAIFYWSKQPRCKVTNSHLDGRNVN